MVDYACGLTPETSIIAISAIQCTQ